jgi:tRNA (adenine37-N6)-methyltransferase
MKSVTMAPIGVVRSSRKQILDDRWQREESYIELDAAKFSSEALAGLTDFSHVEVIFYMDQVTPDKIETAARHPRNNRE